MSRILPNWIDGYLRYMKDTEHPIPYHIWNAISCISGALQRRVYMPWGMQKIYPNMFIILVGPSGVGKGESMKPMISIFKETGLRMAPESITIEDLMRFMAESEFQFETLEGGYETHSSVSVFSKELVVLFGQRDVKKLGIITDWYDSDDTWKNSTKNKGVDDIIGVCLNLLGAAASDWFPQILPPSAIGGGLTSRIIFVVEQRKSQIISRPIYTEEHEKLKRVLTADLQRIAMDTVGPFKFTDKGMAAYEKYYIEQEEEVLKGIWPIRDPTFEGYCNRRALHLRKMSMIFAVARGSEGEVTEEDFAQSMIVLKNAELKMPYLFGGVGKGIHAEVINKIRAYIAQFKQVTRSKILRAFYQDVDAQSIKIIEETLEKMGMITIERSANLEEATYTLREEWDV